MTDTKIIRICSSLLLGSFIFAICCVGQSTGSPDALWPDLSGDWAMAQYLVAAADLPLVGQLFIYTTVGVLTHVSQSGSELVMQDAYCFTDAEPSTPLFMPHIGDDVMRSICPDPRTVQLEQTDQGIRMSQDWHVEVRGALLENPASDPLPTTPDDSRLVDQEGDGFPGMTIRVELVGLYTGSTYAVQRYRYRLYGDVVDENTIIGFIEWTSEQTIVAATNDLFLLPFADYTDPDSTKHKFIMTRVDETWTCDTLREQLPALIEQLEL
ncbi:MAG: hypothetical protein E4H08_08320 [Candidatus Atribacteria bacterium]|nr:MAG: hypothetical protein E4H08_08320 [Candidatus Atribacteria bacterium]